MHAIFSACSYIVLQRSMIKALTPLMFILSQVNEKHVPYSQFPPTTEHWTSRFCTLLLLSIMSK